VGVFTDKVVLIVGGSTGIGRATAVAFAQEGARVAVGARHEADGAETIELVREAGGEGVFIRTDATDMAQVDDLVRQTVSRWGGLHFAFNNAGSGVNKPVAELTADEWHADIAVNLHAVFYGLRHQIPAIVASGGGAIVNMSSQTSLVAAPGFGAYGAAKTGVLGLTRTAAIENAKAGVRVNAISPGTVLTPITATVPADMDRAIMAAVPIGRRGKPEEVASAVLYLCSPLAAFITGANLSVDGGFTAGQLLE
jgi:NAD(P)-dependent dehydrogenase (short-subunit alcohol dehydrogenase family)